MPDISVTLPKHTDYEDGKDLAIGVVDACAKAGVPRPVVRAVERIDPYIHEGPTDYLLAVRLLLENHGIVVLPLTAGQSDEPLSLSDPTA